MSSFQPSSTPESGIDVCSARHDKYFPRSSMVGVKLNTDCVTLPSVEICHFPFGHWKWDAQRMRLNGVQSVNQHRKREEHTKKKKTWNENELRKPVNRSVQINICKCKNAIDKINANLNGNAISSSSNIHPLKW